jgi:hypothetical protein
MSLLSAWSISLDSTFNEFFPRLFHEKRKMSRLISAKICQCEYCIISENDIFLNVKHGILIKYAIYSYERTLKCSVLFAAKLGVGSAQMRPPKCLKKMRAFKSTVAPDWIGLKVVCLDRAWYVYGSRMVKGFFYLAVFSLFKISSPSGILPIQYTCSALHAIYDYSRQRGRKGNRLNFAIAPQVIWALLTNW